MKTRAWLVCWTLLLVPALLLGGWALRLLGHEQERIERQVREAAGLRLEAAAAGLRATVSRAEGDLMALLAGLPAGGEVAALDAVRSSHPLVRNAFMWEPGEGVVYPRADEATTEQQRFLARYEPLLTGRDPWPPQAAPDTPRGVSAARVQRTAGVNRLDGGWRPWFRDDRLYLLGWVRRDDGTVLGVEMDWPVLLSRIVAAFPQPGEGWTYALTDGAGRLMHQAGPGDLTDSLRPDLAQSLAPELPHWQLTAVATAGGAPAAAGRGFALVGGLLIAIFLVAIGSGGALLSWQAMAQRRDARRKTTFVSNVSHELKTPLTTLRMYAELLSENRVADEAKRRHYLAVMVQEAQRLTRLVNNVLDFSRLEQGRKAYRPETMAVGPLLETLLDAQAARLAAEGLQVCRSVDAPETRVRVDRDAVEQVLLNLLDNAVKYAAGGGEVTVAGARRTDGGYTLRVEDRGPGVPADYRRRLFEKFYRGDPSLTDCRPGSGLGLSIARGLMRDLGGDVRFEPREGGGSRFVVELPPAREEDAA